MHKITVVNKRTHQRTSDGIYIYIGRPSPLGNPYAMTSEALRDEVCDGYIRYLSGKISIGDSLVVNELRRIHRLHLESDIYLECWCSPKRCHGDYIKEVLELMC